MIIYCSTCKFHHHFQTYFHLSTSFKFTSIALFVLKNISQYLTNKIIPQYTLTFQTPMNQNHQLKNPPSHPQLKSPSRRPQLIPPAVPNVLNLKRNAEIFTVHTEKKNSLTRIIVNVVNVLTRAQIMCVKRARNVQLILSHMHSTAPNLLLFVVKLTNLVYVLFWLIKHVVKLSVIRMRIVGVIINVVRRIVVICVHFLQVMKKEKLQQHHQHITIRALQDLMKMFRLKKYISQCLRVALLS
jgi:hypothetical protein